MKKLLIQLSDEDHKELRITAAEGSTSMQALVEKAVKSILVKSQKQRLEKYGA